MLEPDFNTAVAIFAGSFALTAFGGLLSYRLVETNWAAGIIGGIGYAVAMLLAADFLIGPRWNPSFAAFEQAVFIAVGGVGLGAAFVLTTFEPETSDDSGEQGGDYYRPANATDDGSTDIPGGIEDLED